MRPSCRPMRSALALAAVSWPGAGLTQSHRGLLRAGATYEAADGSNTRRSQRQYQPQWPLRPLPPVPGASDFALRQDKPATPGAEAPQTPAQQAMPQRNSPGPSHPHIESVVRNRWRSPNSPRLPQVQDALDKLNALPQETGRSAPSGTEHRQRCCGQEATHAVKILSFEGEVDPFQFTVLSTGPLGFPQSLAQ